MLLIESYDLQNQKPFQYQLLIKSPFSFKDIWFEDIRGGSAVLRGLAKSFETNFVSILRREFGL